METNTRLPRARRRMLLRFGAPVTALAMILASCGSNGNDTGEAQRGTSNQSSASSSESHDRKVGTNTTLSSGASTAPSDGAGSSQELTSLKADFSFPYAGAQWYCIYDYGKKKGFYQDNGVDPSFAGLSGSSTIVNEVATGHVDIGLSVGVTTVIPAVSKGAPIKLVATQERASEFASISLAKDPIKKPQDLVGKKIGYGASTVFSIALPLFLKVNGIDKGDVEIHNVQPTSYASALQSGAIDAYMSFPSSSVPKQKEAGGDPVVMLYKDYGLNFSPSNGYISSDDMIQNDPEVITEFLKGAKESWLYLFQHQNELPAAGKYCATQHDGIDPATVKAQLKEIFKLNHDQLSSAAIMSIDGDGIAHQADLLKQAGAISDNGSPQDYYTSDLLPGNS